MHKTCVTLIALLLSAGMARAQMVERTRPQDQSDEVVKVFTELIQTDVMVFDKQGRFVKDLKRENFELRIDGKIKPIGFFDRVQAGTSSEEAQLAAARGGPATSAGKSTAAPLDRGRPVFFFVDDMHLSVSSLDQARKVLARFIDRDLKQNDEAEIMTASGRLGFLQQLTDNKTVLRAAINRLTPGPMAAKDLLRPPMGEYQALQISRGDRDTMGFFIDAVMAETRMSRTSAEDEVGRRAALILDQAAHLTTITLASLDNLVRSSATLPGRKLIFLISDGFFIDSGHSDSVDRMRLLTSAAARSGAIIYSIDARGLIALLDDASKQRPVDLSHRLSRGGMGEIVSSQDGLNALARDTGGRALFNTNDLYVAVGNGLRETSTYYLLAWRPEHDGNGSSKFRRLEVSIVGRPDLTVRVRRGFFDLEPPAANAGKRKETPDQSVQTQTAEAKVLREAIMAPYPKTEIPISLSLNYLDTSDKGASLAVSMKIPGESLSFDADAVRSAQVDLAGVLFDDRGQSTNRFGERVTLNAVSASARAGDRELSYSHTIFLKPGLYQVRVAARDVKTEHVGSANTWIEIPDLSNRKLAISSLLLGERSRSESATSIPISASPDSVRLSIDRRFSRDSFLRYVVFIYNATRAPADQLPDVVVQMQVLRDGHPVATTPLKRVSVEGAQDLQRLAHAAELPLEGFPAGRYVLLFIAIDRIAKTTASQQIRFEIE